MKELDKLRQKIDLIDEQIVNLFAERMQCVSKIGEIKKHNNLNVVNLNRWQQVIQNITQQSQQKSLNVEFMQHIYELIHQEAIRIEKQDKNI